MNPSNTNFSNIAAEIQMQFYSYLEPEDLARAAAVSRLWRQRASDEKLWKFFLQRLPQALVSHSRKINPELTNRELYILCHNKCIDLFRLSLGLTSHPFSRDCPAVNYIDYQLEKSRSRDPFFIQPTEEEIERRKLQIRDQFGSDVLVFSRNILRNAESSQNRGSRSFLSQSAKKALRDNGLSLSRRLKVLTVSLSTLQMPHRSILAKWNRKDYLSFILFHLLALSPVMVSSESTKKEKTDLLTIMELLLISGASPDADTTHSMVNDQNKRLLFKSVENRFHRSLLDKQNSSALHLAANLDWEGPLKLLLTYGSNANYPTIEGVTPLHVACKNVWTDHTRQLLLYGARPDAPYPLGFFEAAGFMPIHLCASSLALSKVAALLDYGADPDSTTPDGKLSDQFLPSPERQQPKAIAIQNLLNIHRLPRISLDELSLSHS